MKSFSEAARVLKRDDYKLVAEENATFILEKMSIDGRLVHSWRNGKTGVYGFLEDYAFLIDGLLSLYQTTFAPRWLEIAHTLTYVALNRFQDKQNGGFYDTPSDHETLITRPKMIFDQAISSSGAIFTKMLLTLNAYTRDIRFKEDAQKALMSIGSILERQPTGLCSWLTALSLFLTPPVEVTLLGDPSSVKMKQMLSIIFESYRPNTVVALQPDGQDYSERIQILKDRRKIQDQPTAYVCKESVCKKPTTHTDELQAILDAVV